MDYEFQRHEPCFDRVMFVLTLDRKKMKERIVAGKEAAIRSRLRGNPDAEVICDAVRPLGTFLTDFEQDPDGEWNRSGLAPLREALHTNRWKQPDLGYPFFKKTYQNHFQKGLDILPECFLYYPFQPSPDKFFWCLI